MGINLEQIEEFLAAEEIAIVGVSRSPKKFGYQVYKNFKDRKFNVYPVNPFSDTIEGDRCFKKIADLPETVKNILVICQAEGLLEILQHAQEKGIRNVWIQKDLYTSESLDYAKSNFENLIYGECVFMWTNPVKGVHSFHKGIRKLFGGLPK